MKSIAIYSTVWSTKLAKYHVWELIRESHCFLKGTKYNPNASPDKWMLAYILEGRLGFAKNKDSRDSNTIIPTYKEGEVLRAYEQTGNKLLNWWRKNFNYVKVDVTEITSERVKDIPVAYCMQMGIIAASYVVSKKRGMYEKYEMTIDDNTHAIGYTLKELKKRR